MHAFADASGRQWPIILNRGAVRRLWDALRVNLHDPGAIARLCNQERFLLLPQVLDVLLQEGTEKLWPEIAGKPAERLDRIDELLDTDAVFDAAHAALVAELADFCRSRGRTALAQYLDATPRLLAKETRANLAQLPEISTLEAELDARLPTPGNSSTSSPEKSESIQNA